MDENYYNSDKVSPFYLIRKYLIEELQFLESRVRSNLYKVSKLLKERSKFDKDSKSLMKQIKNDKLMIIRIKMKIKIQTDKSNKLRLSGGINHTRNFSDSSVDYEFEVNEDNKKAFIKMLCDSLDVKMHSNDECVGNLHQVLKDHPEGVRSAYNKLMTEIENYENR